MISIAVCDDAKSVVNSMESFLDKYAIESGETIQVFKFYSGDSLLTNYSVHYDIIFLDIKMPGITGIETAKKIRAKDDKVTIIFLTALFGHAVDGYQVQAASFIIKPMSYKRLWIEMNHWRSKIREKEDSFIIINNTTGSYKVLLKSIRYIETANRNLLIHTDKGMIISYRKLKSIEIELSPYGFARCHSSYITNLLHIEKIEQIDILLFSGERIPISRAKKRPFMESLAEYWGGCL